MKNTTCASVTNQSTAHTKNILPIVLSVKKRGADLLFIYLTFSLSGEGHCYRFPQLQQALLYRFVVEEVTVHNTSTNLLLSTSVWVLLSPPIERRETRPTV